MKPYKTVLKNRLKLAKGKVKQLHIVCRTRMSWTTALSYWILKLFHGNTLILNTLRRNYIKNVCQNGGDILEIGFGGGITADMIQTHNIKTHVIIERDDVFFNKLGEWAKNKSTVKTIHGDWISEIPTYKKYDGIFVDLWDNIEDYSRRVELHQIIENHTKPGTIFICATENAFDKELYIEKGHKCEEIKVEQPKLKWYNLLSHIIKTDSPVFKVTFK
jgi:hypothetical protein|tara:strand:+ start:973 stop:1626 length:654 start_codon:yes stop_codon:yes gene_type:complete